MDWRRLAPCLAWPALLALAVLAAPARAAEPASPSRGSSLSAEERLDAIRHGLVQAALEGATRVESVAWMDAQGRLQESSSFRSGMQVRGVQVLAYVRDAEGQPRARLQLPAAQTPAARNDIYKEAAAKAAPACPANEGLRHLIGLELVMGGRWSVQDAPLAHALAEMVGAAWLQADPAAERGSNARDVNTAKNPAGGNAAGHANWRMLADGPEAFKSADEAPRSAYEKAMLGITSVPLPWVASIQVQPGPPAAAAAAQWRTLLQPMLGQPAALTTARVSLRLSQTNASGRSPAREALVLSADLPLLREPSQWGAPQFSAQGRAQVQALLARWSLAVSEQVACEAVRPEVLPNASGTLRLNVGALAGVQPGDEWLLADPGAFPERLLAPEVAQQLVLAKVHKVHARHAELQVLAGPARHAQPGWRAWRAESPLLSLQADPQ